MQEEGLKKFEDVFKDEQYRELMNEREFMVVSENYFFSSCLKTSSVFTFAMLAIEQAFVTMLTDGNTEENAREVLDNLKEHLSLALEYAKEAVKNGNI